MAIPNKTNLQTMDYSYMGEPYIQVASKSGIDLDSLDYSYFGQPFYGVIGITHEGNSALLTTTELITTGSVLHQILEGGTYVSAFSQLSARKMSEWDDAPEIATSETIINFDDWNLSKLDTYDIANITHAVMEGTVSINETSELAASATVLHQTFGAATGILGASALGVEGSIAHQTVETESAIETTSSLTILGEVTHQTLEGTTNIVVTSEVLAVSTKTSTHDGVSTIETSSILTTAGNVSHVVIDGAVSINGTTVIYIDNSVWHQTLEGSTSIDVTSELLTFPEVGRIFEGVVRVEQSSELTVLATLAHAILMASTILKGSSYLGTAEINNDLYPHIIINGAGSTEINDTYIYDYMYEDKPLYVGINTGSLIAYSSMWMIVGGSYLLYYSTDDVATPDLATMWNILDGLLPIPNIVESLISYDNLSATITHYIANGLSDIACASSFEVSGNIAYAIHEGEVVIVNTSTIQLDGHILVDIQYAEIAEFNVVMSTQVVETVQMIMNITNTVKMLANTLFMVTIPIEAEFDVESQQLINIPVYKELSEVK